MIWDTVCGYGYMGSSVCFNELSGVMRFVWWENKGYMLIGVCRGLF